MTRDLVVRSNGSIQCRVNLEYPRNAADPGQDAILFSDDGRGRPLIRIDAGIACRIARGPILVQRVLDNRGKASAIPVHVRVWGGRLRPSRGRVSAVPQSRINGFTP